MSKKIRLLSVGLVVFVLVFVVFAGTALATYDWTSHRPDKSMVIYSAHNPYPGDPTKNPCEACHMPHNAKGAFLFAKTPLAINTGDTIDSSTSDIRPLCYSCHNGGVASSGLNTAFSNNVANHLTNAASVDTQHRTERDCDRCHDPHDNGNTNFLRYERYSSRSGWVTFHPNGGMICNDCHANSVGANTHVVAVAPKGTAPDGQSWPADEAFDGVSDLSGTRMFLPTSPVPIFRTSVDYASTQVGCESCHTPHGAPKEVTSVLETDGTTTQFYALNSMAKGKLCLNCHGNIPAPPA